MTKKEIVKTISEEIGLTQLKTKEIVQRTFNAIVDTLVDETRRKIESGQDKLDESAGDKKGTLGRIELRNFGVFEVKKRAARKARNPRTGDKVFVPEKYVVTFKPGKEMEERIRELEERAAEKARQAAAMQAAQQPVVRSPNSSQPTGLSSGYEARPGGTEV